MTIYKIINPSDEMTIEADDVQIARVATVLLGQGQYGLRDAGTGEAVMPILCFGNPEPWLEENQLDIESIMSNRKAEVAACLESAMYIGASERASILKAIEAAGGDKAKALAAFNEEQRSSMNNICGRARDIAASIRGDVDDVLKGNTAPKQVFSI